MFDGPSFVPPWCVLSAYSLPSADARRSTIDFGRQSRCFRPEAAAGFGQSSLSQLDLYCCHTWRGKQQREEEFIHNSLNDQREEKKCYRFLQIFHQKSLSFKQNGKKPVSYSEIHSFIIERWHKMTYKKLIILDFQAILQSFIEQYGQKYSTNGLPTIGSFKESESLHLV